MGAPVAAAAALGNTRTGRKAVVAVLLAAVLALMFLMTPLLTVTMALANSAASIDLRQPDPVVTTSGDWAFPLAGDYVKGRGFGYNPVVGCSYCSTNHKGYDMAQGCGASIRAAGPGEVITAGALSGWGNTVRIDHGGGLITLYGHMQWGSLRVTVGEAVDAGAVLGAEGNTGNSFGCHLHFEVQKSGTPVDPQPFMAALGLPLT